MIQFKAQLWKITVDSEGEAKITLVVPLSELAEVVKLHGMTQAVIMVTMEVER